MPQNRIAARHLDEWHKNFNFKAINGCRSVLIIRAATTVCGYPFYAQGDPKKSLVAKLNKFCFPTY
jgi:hypothetical protein